MSLLKMIVAAAEADGEKLHPPIIPIIDPLASKASSLLEALELIGGVSISVIVTKEPLTPLQTAYIDACVQAKEFSKGENKL